MGACNKEEEKEEEDGKNLGAKITKKPRFALGGSAGATRGLGARVEGAGRASARAAAALLAALCALATLERVAGSAAANQATPGKSRRPLVFAFGERQNCSR